MIVTDFAVFLVLGKIFVINIWLKWVDFPAVADDTGRYRVLFFADIFWSSKMYDDNSFLFLDKDFFIFSFPDLETEYLV